MLKGLTKPFMYPKPVIEAKGTARKKAEKAKNWTSTVKKLWDYLSVQKGGIAAVLFLVILSTGLSLLGPVLIGRTVDQYIVTKEIDGLLTLLLFILIVYVLYSVAVFLQGYIMIGIAQNTVSRMRTDLFTHLHRLPISFFDKRQSGELMSRVTNDIENVSSTLNSSVIQVFSSILMLVGTISVMVWLSPLLTLISLIIVPLMFLGMKWITNRTGVLFKAQQRNLGELNGFIEETISGQRIVKTFSQEHKVIDEFIKKNGRLRESGFWAQTFSGFIPKLMNGLNNVSFTIIAAIGGIFALNGMITIGVIIVFAEYSRQFTRPLNDLANQFNTLLSAVAGAERVFEILAEDSESLDETDAIELEKVKGKVEFREVSFSYNKGGDTVRNITFIAEPGQMVALVGPTGAGKSTVINLLSRFYDPDNGLILLDGHNTALVKRKSLRSHMGFVLQDSFLFEGPIIENIRYGRLDATDEEVVEAAKMANAHSFITKLPNGYQTLLKQDGGGISQGQKQLLSIARAILANPSVLILDEATSSIDTITELSIQEALGRLMEGRTSFVIAHRLNTIRNADAILVLNDGQIVEQGSHESLLKQKGYYYTLQNSKE
ncbi:multidrug ABC transporter ATP-binding protein [Bacillus sp. FJAT-27225]|uniref:ABC transporter ATP-binding protein n=1 Tax=Bacillus sp. FJAT-27225 TaxID=1743144 RepID=UPI00080C29F0|nr:ABC transporter ATP-binding protein [Bacillus sp. FJAT-27225]OCA83055.1 multidrug ABC transporter ATP-binding protein [Bacillus sp. FJAT-27225]